MEGRNGELSRRAQRLRAGALATVLAMLCWAAPASAVVSTGDNPQTSGISPPTPSTAPSESGTERDDEDLTGDEGSWPVLTSTDHIWLRCNSAGTGCAQISTNLVYTLTPADVDRRLKFRVRGTALSGDYRELDAVTGVIDAISPTVDTVPTISGTTTDGQTLSTTTGTWDGTPTIGNYSYQWQRCTPACSNIAGATSATYVLKSADYNNRVRVRVTARRTENASDTGTADSAQTALIAAAPTSNATDPQINGIARQGEILSAGNGTWNGTTPLTYTYVWKRCAPTCSQTVGNGALYAVAAADVGNKLELTVTATGPGGQASESVMSATVAPRPPSGGGSGGGGSTTGGGTTGGGTTTLRKLSPFPVVAIGGRVFRRGVRVSQLKVSRAPRGAVVTVTCRGRGCPFRRMRRTVKRRSGLRLRRLERTLRPGTVIVIIVRKGNTLGKYTRLRIRRGSPPARIDRCIRPGARRPTACPS